MDGVGTANLQVQQAQPGVQSDADESETMLPPLTAYGAGREARRRSCQVAMTA